MGGAGALANIKAHADSLGEPQQVLNASRVRDQAPRCSQVLGIGAAKRLALEHLAGGKALAHDQTPSLSTKVSEVVHCVLWCAQSKVNIYYIICIQNRYIAPTMHGILTIRNIDGE